MKQIIGRISARSLHQSSYLISIYHPTEIGKKWLQNMHNHELKKSEIETQIEHNPYDDDSEKKDNDIDMDRFIPGSWYPGQIDT